MKQNDLFVMQSRVEVVGIRFGNNRISMSRSSFLISSRTPGSLPSSPLSIIFSLSLSPSFPLPPSLSLCLTSNPSHSGLYILMALPAGSGAFAVMARDQEVSEEGRR